MLMLSLEVWFTTTTANKHDSDEIYIEIWGNGGAQRLTGATIPGGNEWGRHSVCGPFGLWLQHPAESRGLQLAVGKSGTDEWGFDVRAVGHSANGSAKDLLPGGSSGHFGDQPGSTRFNLGD